jgi:hypothetical protein
MNGLRLSGSRSQPTRKAVGALDRRARDRHGHEPDEEEEQDQHECRVARVPP